jgi:hypothetical protein
MIGYDAHHLIPRNMIDDSCAPPTASNWKFVAPPLLRPHDYYALKEDSN